MGIPRLRLGYVVEHVLSYMQQHAVELANVETEINTLESNGLPRIENDAFHDCMWVHITRNGIHTAGIQCTHPKSDKD